MEDTIKDKLSQLLLPIHLEVVDDSHLHAGHAGVAEKGGSHFSVTIVSDMFDGKNKVERQRLVNGALAEELKNDNRQGIHALSMQTLTPEEWLGGR